MKLSLKEYDAMQSGWRKWINEHLEMGGFKAWGMDFTGKDILEVGCGSGYSASLQPYGVRSFCHIYCNITHMRIQVFTRISMRVLSVIFHYV